MLRLFRARTLQKYVLKETSVVFALTLLACTLFLLLAFLFQLSNEYSDKGITFGQIALLFPFFLPKIVAFAAPVATMIAATMVFSRLSAEDELIAAQAGGAPLSTLTVPVVCCSIILCGICLWANQGGISWGFSTIRNKILKVDKPDSFFEALDSPGRSLSLPNDTGGFVKINLLPHERDPATKKVRKPIHIAFFQNQQVGKTVLADDFSYVPMGAPGDRSLRLTLAGGQMLGDNPSFFKEVTMDIHIPSISSLVNFGVSRGQKGWWDNYLDSKKIDETIQRRRRFILDRAADFTASAISSWPGEPVAPAELGTTWSGARIATEAIFSVGGAYDQQHQHYVECWQKLGISLLPFSVSFLGIGLGLLVKKSNRLVGFLIGLVVYALVYYPLSIIARELAGTSRFGVWIIFVPNILMFLLGYILCYAYERGELTSLPPIFSNAANLVVTVGMSIWRLISPVQHFGRWLFRRKTDGYIAGSFIVPLLVVVMTLAAVFTAFDFFEHGNDTIEGIIKAGDPLPGLPTRGFAEACTDVVVYYGISSLAFISDMLPFIVLAAGLLCVYVLIRNNEHLIVKSAGLPLQRAFRPVMILTLLFSLGVTAIRETVMPSLLMHRDYLKPLVYRRTPAPTAIGMYTHDADNHPVIFEMSEYAPSTRSGKNLRIFLLDEPGKRISTIVADRAVWDGDAWQLQTDPTRIPGEKAEKKVVDEFDRALFGPSSGKGAPVALDGALNTVQGQTSSFQLQAVDTSGHHHEFSIAKPPAHGKVELSGDIVKYTPNDKYAGADEIQFQAANAGLKSNTAKVFVTVFLPVGCFIHPQSTADTQTPVEGDSVPVQIKNTRAPLTSWRGTITPAYLESERINNKGVMRLEELRAAGSIKADFAVEWWKRVSEAAMGIFLLWVTIPLLLKEESRGPLIGVAWSILIGALYWCLYLAASEIACGGWLPTWGPLIPHAAFLLIGSRSYYLTMET